MEPGGKRRRGTLLASDPERIGRYLLTERLGAGGMGRVYLARTPSGRQVVVKVIRPEYVKDDEFRARFVREA
ncbi:MULTISPECIES: AarF/UbiB family protein [unclassified Nocardiopsis]|uniref:AarF/UbiB family protein n=1 Tax=Nocardiopsis TaxID=2013 RepID=UPI00387B6F9A